MTPAPPKSPARIQVCRRDRLRMSHTYRGTARPTTSLLTRLPASHKVDNLQPVAIRQRSPAPLLARHNLAIQFHGNPVALHLKLFHQRVQRARRIAPLFSIDRQSHQTKIADCPPCPLLPFLNATFLPNYVSNKLCGKCLRPWPGSGARAGSNCAVAGATRSQKEP